MATAWSTSPSFGSMDTRIDHPSQRISFDSTVKLGPSGWWISRGRRPAREWLVVLGVVAAGLGGDGDHPVVRHLEDLATGGVHGGHHSFDGPGISVVGGLLAVVGEAAGDATVRLHLAAEVAGGPWIDLHLVHVGDAPAADGLLPLRVGPQGGDGAHGLLEEQRRPHAGVLLPLLDHRRRAPARSPRPPSSRGQGR